MSTWSYGVACCWQENLRLSRLDWEYCQSTVRQESKEDAKRSGAELWEEKKLAGPFVSAERWLDQIRLVRNHKGNGVHLLRAHKVTKSTRPIWKQRKENGKQKRGCKKQQLSDSQLGWPKGLRASSQLKAHFHGVLGHNEGRNQKAVFMQCAFLGIWAMAPTHFASMYLSSLESIPRFVFIHFRSTV